MRDDVAGSTDDGPEGDGHSDAGEGFPLV
jgi:hypothetical protein